MAHLDFREKAGYSRQEMTVFSKAEGEQVLFEGCVLYLGEEEVEEFIGPADFNAVERHFNAISTIVNAILTLFNAIGVSQGGDTRRPL